MYNVSIPKISKEELLKRYEKIKPIVTIGGKKYFLREFTEEELTRNSYLWNRHADIRELVDEEVYIPLEDRDFECIHKYGYYGLFKPSIAEVLAQLTDVDVAVAAAFEIIESPETSADFYKNEVVFKNGFHISKVRLYYNSKGESYADKI